MYDEQIIGHYECKKKIKRENPKLNHILELRQLNI